MSLLQNRFLTFVIILSAVMCTALPSFGSDFFVTKTEDTNDGSCSDDCSLREAIIAANDSSSDSNTIYVPAGTYWITLPGDNEDEAASGDFDITNSMTIIGDGMDATIINALGLFGVHDRVFHVNAPNQTIGFEKLGIYGGYALGPGFESVQGGGVFIANAREVQFYQCHLYRNEALYGGAIYFGDTPSGFLPYTLTIEESVVDRNEALNGGGILVGRIALSIDKSTITGNNASEYGGGLRANSVIAEILNSTFYKNVASYGGSEMMLFGDFLMFFSYSTLVSSDPNIETIDINYHATSPSPFAFLRFLNSIVWGRCLSDISGVFATAGGNMGVPSNTCNLDDDSDIISEPNPLLLPLGDYGGPTPTAPPALGSLAIDNGIYLDDLSTPFVDQRGVLRPQSGDGNATEEWDIGSVERESFTNFVKRLFNDLEYMVKDPSIPSGIKKSLSYKVANSDKSYDKGNFRAAINQLEAIKNFVEAQREKAMTDTQADNIIFLSNEAIMVLENED